MDSLFLNPSVWNNRKINKLSITLILSHLFDFLVVLFNISQKGGSRLSSGTVHPLAASKRNQQDSVLAHTGSSARRFLCVQRNTYCTCNNFVLILFSLNEKA
jgi:hypothetical protein